jgi:hypothetical protein
MHDSFRKRCYKTFLLICPVTVSFSVYHIGETIQPIAIPSYIYIAHVAWPNLLAKFRTSIYCNGNNKQSGLLLQAIEGKKVLQVSILLTLLHMTNTDKAEKIKPCSML